MIRRLQADEVEALKAIRLESLATDPAAFCSTFDGESALPEAEWEARALRGAESESQAVFVLDLGQLRGILGVVLVEPDHADLWGVFVAPDARGHGWARQLVEAGLAWARQAGATHITLEANAALAPALALYHATGFQLDGRRRQLGDKDLVGFTRTFP
ncbi:MAG: N-acetyltransferase family protein [Vulcanimicrobiota bacterium]